jgi:hypothetical protein
MNLDSHRTKAKESPTRAAVRIAFVVVLVPIAGWAAQKIDVSNDSITCNTVIATVSVKPPLVTGGTATSVVMAVKGSVAGCTVTGSNAASILSGKLSGKITATSNECITVFEPLTGTITMKWKADRTTPILQTSSTLNITNVSFSLFGAPWNMTYGQFSLGTSSVTGAFTGGDNGATSSNTSLTSQDIGEILNECGSPTGLKTLNVGLGQVTLQ